MEETVHNLMDLIFEKENIKCISRGEGEYVFTDHKYWIYYYSISRRYYSGYELVDYIQKFIPISKLKIIDYINSWCKKNKLWENKVWE